MKTYFEIPTIEVQKFSAIEDVLTLSDGIDFGERGPEDGEWD